MQFYYVALKMPGLKDSYNSITLKQASGMEWIVYNVL